MYGDVPSYICQLVSVSQYLICKSLVWESTSNVRQFYSMNRIVNITIASIIAQVIQTIMDKWRFLIITLNFYQSLFCLIYSSHSGDFNVFYYQLKQMLTTNDMISIFPLWTFHLYVPIDFHIEYISISHLIRNSRDCGSYQIILIEDCCKRGSYYTMDS